MSETPFLSRSADEVLDGTEPGRRSGRLSYSVVTPVRNEADNLRRLGAAMEAQRLRPATWLIVDTGSSDDTLSIARELVADQPYVSVRELSLGDAMMRGGPIVRAFHFGLGLLPDCDIVVKLDADTSFEPEYFDRLVAEFEKDERLGIASGSCYEERPDGVWRQRHGTGAEVWGASRAYRRSCLEKILPLEERMGWDTIDLVSANVRGWKTRTVRDLPFLHHRREGERELSRFSFFVKQGDASHYMGYRPSYLAIRTLFHTYRDPAAIGIAWGYLTAALQRKRRCTDGAVRTFIRSQQRMSRLHLRATEALRPRSALAEPLRPGRRLNDG